MNEQTLPDGVIISAPDGAVIEFGPVKQPINTKMTKQKFKLRFTQEERIAIREASKVNPVVFDFQDLLDSGSHADLADDVLITGLNAMESLSLLDEGRANEILSAPILEHEAWRD